ncbi:MAG: response regulator [Kiritimatiellae bacterium]|nr:response regulator [Kiritimatiellia bacterium]
MRRRVLIIDDEPEFVDMIKMRLEANECEVLTAHDGPSGLEKIRKERPGLVLLDVMMPGMDGFQVLREIRQSDDIAHIPVVMLTAKGESKSLFKAEELGATDYLIKPCNSQDLVKIVRKHALPIA